MSKLARIIAVLATILALGLAAPAFQADAEAGKPPAEIARRRRIHQPQVLGAGINLHHGAPLAAVAAAVLAQPMRDDERPQVRRAGIPAANVQVEPIRRLERGGRLVHGFSRRKPR